MKEIDKILFMIFDNDKTPDYTYSKKSVNRCYDKAGLGRRFKTPREIILDYYGLKFWKKYYSYREQLQKAKEE